MEHGALPLIIIKWFPSVRAWWEYFFNVNVQQIHFQLFHIQNSNIIAVCMHNQNTCYGWGLGARVLTPPRGACPQASSIDERVVTKDYATICTSAQANGNDNFETYLFKLKGLLIPTGSQIIILRFRNQSQRRRLNDTCFLNACAIASPTNQIGLQVYACSDASKHSHVKRTIKHDRPRAHDVNRLRVQKSTRYDI